MGAYPVPHHTSIRRNFTVNTWPNFAGLFKDSTALPVDNDILTNSTFVPREVDSLVGGFPGDFKGFQAFLERLQVSLTT